MTSCGWVKLPAGRNPPSGRLLASGDRYHAVLPEPTALCHLQSWIATNLEKPLLPAECPISLNLKEGGHK
jgi:hypothetical protein